MYCFDLVSFLYYLFNNIRYGLDTLCLANFFAFISIFLAFGTLQFMPVSINEWNIQTHHTGILWLLLNLQHTTIATKFVSTSNETLYYLKWHYLMMKWLSTVKSTLSSSSSSLAKSICVPSIIPIAVFQTSCTVAFWICFCFAMSVLILLSPFAILIIYIPGPNRFIHSI